MSTRLRLVAAAALAALAACQSPKQPASPVVNNAPPRSHGAVVPLGDGVEILLATTGDFDGIPGDELIELRSNGELVIGSESVAVPIEHAEDRAFWISDSVVQVVALDSQRRLAAVVLTTATEGIEDPPHRHRIYVIEDGAIHQILDDVISTPRSGLRFPGDGTARFEDTDWRICEQLGFTAPVAVQEVVLGPDASGALREQGRHPTGLVYNCNDQSACPFVYVVGTDGAVKVGEVLRDLRGADAYALQSLDLPVTDGTASASLAIRVAEEKPEVTYLDEVFVDVGGVRYAPRACDAAAPPAYCAADLAPYVLYEGDTLDLEFDVAVDGPTAVFARGYYVPVATTPR